MIETSRYLLKYVIYINCILFIPNTWAIEFDGIEICSIINQMKTHEIPVDRIKNDLKPYQISWLMGKRLTWKVDTEIVTISTLNGKIDSFTIPSNSDNIRVQKLYQLASDSMISQERTVQLLGEPYLVTNYFEAGFQNNEVLFLEVNQEHTITDYLTTLDCGLLAS